MDVAIKDTDGLYYPHIHVRDEGWLKTALLYFPHILRMLPPGFEAADSPLVRELSHVRGTRGEPLFGNYTVRSLVTDEAVDRLTHRLIDDIETNRQLAEQFSRKGTVEAYGRDWEFLIHRGKAPQYFWSELTQRGLMWFPAVLPETPSVRATLRRRLSRPKPEEWVAVHPRLGEAFMATVATAAAQDVGLEVITDSPYAHGVVSCRDEEVIYRSLIRGGSRTNPSAQEMTLRLAHLAIVGGFDVSQLKPEDLAELSKNREALFDFRSHLAQRVAEIPEMDSESKREAHLKSAAEEVLAQWRSEQANLSTFAKRFFGLGLLEKSEKSMTDLAKALIPASLGGAAAATAAGTAVATAAPAAGMAATLAASPLVVGAAPGLAVALVIYGVKTWHDLRQEKAKGPLRYLSLLEQRGATLMVSAPPKFARL
jgi:hypothetical protein